MGRSRKDKAPKRRKHAQVRDDEPRPATLPGDEEAAPLPVQAHEAAIVHPDDAGVVLEGTSARRVLIIAAGLLAVLALGLYWVDWIDPYPSLNRRLSDYAFAIAGCAAAAWLVNRDFVRPRREFRLVDDGITVEVTPLAGTPRVTHVRWREIADYSVSEADEEAFLGVVSIRGYTLTLRERPPRLSTHEFIRRFVEQADRHPRAAGPEAATADPLPDITGERKPITVGCVGWIALLVLGSFAKSYLEPSAAQMVTGAALLGVVTFGLSLWWSLDDPDVAALDRDSRRLVARLRRWLRRVLGIRVS